MLTHMQHLKHNSPGAWAKRYYLATRGVMELILRPYDVGPAQWYVLWHLANKGPTTQRDLLAMLDMEKPALSEVVRALVRKGLIVQTPDVTDQRQRMLKITPAGMRLWRKMPDPIDLILKTSFDGMDADQLAIVVQVLQTATQRLHDYLEEKR
jgi:DNA-binding MarR family transcriptional regulator